MIESRKRSPVARRVIAGLAVLSTSFSSIACSRSQSAPRAQPDAGEIAQGATQGDGSLRFPILPDPEKTPGATLEVTAADVCVPGYARRVRNVPIEVKRRAYAQYGIRTHEPGEYEVDHLISLKLGGSNSIRNLWPESFRTEPWNAYVKDALENELYRRVCSGRMDLAKAQQVIANNWVIGYRLYVSPNTPTMAPRASDGSRPRYSRRTQPKMESTVP
jgi:hypothetical protein